MCAFVRVYLLTEFTHNVGACIAWHQGGDLMSKLIPDHAKGAAGGGR